MVALFFPNLLEVCRLPRLGPGGPVVYAALAQGDRTRDFLAARLLASLAGLDPDWAAAPAWGPVVLDTGPLGQPLLSLGGKPGPAISFSEAGGLLWGAMAARGRVGIDAALDQDFAPPYPYSRTFRPAEWDWAWRHCQGLTPSAAALLWAAKEAAVKALGVGFHTFFPQDVTVEPSSPYQNGLLLTVRAGEAVSAWTSPLEAGWRSLALV